MSPPPKERTGELVVREQSPVDQRRSYVEAPTETSPGRSKLRDAPSSIPPKEKAEELVVREQSPVDQRRSYVEASTETSKLSDVPVSPAPSEITENSVSGGLPIPSGSIPASQLEPSEQLKALKAIVAAAKPDTSQGQRDDRRLNALTGTDRKTRHSARQAILEKFRGNSKAYGKQESHQDDKHGSPGHSAGGFWRNLYDRFFAKRFDAKKDLLQTQKESDEEKEIFVEG